MTTQGTYQGRPCRHCGGTLRYRFNRSCLACHNGRRPDRTPGMREVRAVQLSTFLALYYPAELERSGWRRVAAPGTSE